MPTRLLKVLQETFTEELLEQVFGPTPAILYGEGYGAGIQKGGNYRPDVAFILFDVLIDDLWLGFENVEEIASSLGIASVPIVMVSTLNHMIRHMSETLLYSFLSGTAVMEGVVGTPLIPLLDRRGGRLIVKLKTEDLHQLAVATGLAAVPDPLPMAA